VSPTDIEQIVPVAQPHVSLDAPLMESEDSSLLDVLSDDDAPNPDDGLRSVSHRRKDDRAGVDHGAVEIEEDDGIAHAPIVARALVQSR